jgi:SAM-dependent methyltransferase
MTRPFDAACQVCGHDEFDRQPVLWPALAAQWELNPAEVEYLDEQQGMCCRRCGTNVRSQALARALMRAAGDEPTFAAFVQAASARSLRLLEINEAGTLTPWLSTLAGHTLVRFPDVDMQRLPFDDAAFDLVVHSDTLEHVERPAEALGECYRVLAPRGACVFTVPVVVGRLTRTRRDLPPSYHGGPAIQTPDYLVHSEFGSDVWTGVLEAGFTSCELVPYRFPAGLALIGHR